MSNSMSQLQILGLVGPKAERLRKYLQQQGTFERKHHEVALGQNAFQFFVNFPIPLMKLSVLGKICQTFPKLEQHKSKASRENEFIKRKYLNWGKRTARRGKTKLV